MKVGSKVVWMAGSIGLVGGTVIAIDENGVRVRWTWSNDEVTTGTSTKAFAKREFTVVESKFNA